MNMPTSDLTNGNTYRAVRNRFHEWSLIVGLFWIFLTVGVLSVLDQGSELVGGALSPRWWTQSVWLGSSCILLGCLLVFGSLLCAQYLVFSTRHIGWRLASGLTLMIGLGLLAPWEAEGNNIATELLNVAPFLLPCMVVPLLCLRGIAGNIQFLRFRDRRQASWFAAVSRFQAKHYLAFLFVLLSATVLISNPAWLQILEPYPIPTWQDSAMWFLLPLIPVSWVFTIPLIATAWVGNRHAALIFNGLGWIVLSVTAFFLIPLIPAVRLSVSFFWIPVITIVMGSQLLLAFCDWWFLTQPFAYNFKLVRQWQNQAETDLPPCPTSHDARKARLRYVAFCLVMGLLASAAYYLPHQWNRHWDLFTLLATDPTVAIADARLIALYHRKVESLPSVAPDSERHDLRISFGPDSVRELRVPEALLDDPEWTDRLAAYQRYNPVLLVIYHGDADSGRIVVRGNGPIPIGSTFSWRLPREIHISKRTLSASELDMAVKLAEHTILEECHLSPGALASVSDIPHLTMIDCQFPSADLANTVGKTRHMELIFSDPTDALAVADGINHRLFDPTRVEVTGPPARLQELMQRMGPHVRGIYQQPQTAPTTMTLGGRHDPWLWPQDYSWLTTQPLPTNHDGQLFQTDATGQLIALWIVSSSAKVPAASLNSPSLKTMLTNPGVIEEMEQPLPNIVCLGLKDSLPETLPERFPNLRHLVCPDLSLQAPNTNTLIQAMPNLTEISLDGFASGFATRQEQPLMMFPDQIRTVEFAVSNLLVRRPPPRVVTLPISGDELLRLSELVKRTRALTKRPTTTGTDSDPQ